MKPKLLVATPVVVMGALASPIPICSQHLNGQIAYAKQIDGTPFADVYTANLDGSRVQFLTLGNSAEAFGIPIWSPDGSKHGKFCQPLKSTLIFLELHDFDHQASMRIRRLEEDQGGAVRRVRVCKAGSKTA